MPLLLTILKPVLTSAAVSLVTGKAKSTLGKLSANLAEKGLMSWSAILLIIIGVIAGAALTWNFKPAQVDVVEKIVDREVIKEVMRPHNCQTVELLDGIKKGESLVKIIRPYAELKAAYVACLNSLK